MHIFEAAFVIYTLKLDNERKEVSHTRTKISSASQCLMNYVTILAPTSHTHPRSFCHMKAQRCSNDEGVESHDMLCTVT